MHTSSGCTTAPSEERRATNTLYLLSAVMEHHDKNAKRKAAEDYVKRFRKSARYWNKTELAQAWFRDDIVALKLENSYEVLSGYSQTYGPDLRRGNEDLDPFVRFEELVFVDKSVYVHVRVGLDDEDAVDFGISLTLHVNTFAYIPFYKSKFGDAFDYDEAMELYAAGAWDHLYNQKLIHTRYDIDVRKAARLYSELLATHRFGYERQHREYPRRKRKRREEISGDEYPQGRLRDSESFSDNE